MMNLKRLSTQPLQAVPNSFVIFLLVIALLGFADASYLTIEHYHNAIPPCTIVSGCEIVLTSAYSTFLGIPISLLGALYYLAILIGAFAYIEGKHERFLRVALVLTTAGMVMSLWFLFLQAFILHSYCLDCLGSALTSTILFVTAVVGFKKYSNREDGNILKP